MKTASNQHWHYFQLTLQLFQLLTVFTTATSVTPKHCQQKNIFTSNKYVNIIHAETLILNTFILLGKSVKNKFLFMGLPITASCDAAWNRTRVCSDTSSTEMQCLRPLLPSGAQHQWYSLSWWFVFRIMFYSFYLYFFILLNYFIYLTRGKATTEGQR